MRNYQAFPQADRETGDLILFSNSILKKFRKNPTEGTPLLGPGPTNRQLALNLQPTNHFEEKLSRVKSQRIIWSSEIKRNLYSKKAFRIMNFIIGNGFGIIQNNYTAEFLLWNSDLFQGNKNCLQFSIKTNSISANSFV